MLLKCWGRFQPSSERARSVGPEPPLVPSLRLPWAPTGARFRGEGGGFGVRYTLFFIIVSEWRQGTGGGGGKGGKGSSVKLSSQGRMGQEGEAEQ